MQYESYLCHHGKEGQQWGIRNGPPYPLDRKGRRALRKQLRDQKKEEKISLKRRQQTSKLGNRLDPKLSTITDDELRKINNRLNLEKQYKDLEEAEISRGQRKTSNVMKKIGATSVIAGTGLGIVGAILKGAGKDNAGDVLSIISKSTSAMGSALSKW